MSRSMRDRHVEILLALALIAPAVDGTEPCDQWQLVNPLPVTTDLLGATHGNGLFIFVGREGTILSSPDEVGWTLSEPVTANDLHAVAWTGHIFVAVGSSGTALTSEDGVSWSSGATPVTTTLLDLAAGPLLVAVGEGGTIVSSVDGLSWTREESGTTADLLGVVWTGSEYLAVGNRPEILASPDGSEWTIRDVGHDGPFTCIASNGSTTVALAEDGSTWVSVSGIQWTRGSGAHHLTEVVWAGDRFIATGGPGSSGPRYSLDGLVWSYSHTTAPGLEITALASDGVMTMGGGVGGTVALSRDGGQHFKPANTFIGLDLYGIAIKDETWVVAAGDSNQGHGSLLTSSDGLNWEITYDMGLETLYDVAANPTAFVAVGVINELWSGGAMILHSQDGRSWTHTGSASGPGDWPWEWQSVAWDGGRFVAAGSGGAVATSDDGWSWHLIGGGQLTDHTFFGAASDGQSLVAVGWTGAIAVSHDGETVTMVRPGYEEGHLFDVDWGSGTFVAVGSTGTILTSTTGDHWQEQSSGTSLDLHGVRFIGEEFVAVGEDGAALISDDGLSWQSIGPVGEESLRDVVQPVSEMTVVGDHGLVMRSACTDPNLPPAPRFAWRPTLPEVGANVRFIDLSLGDPTSWRWDFGDGGLAEGPHATHAFAEPGSWPVTLTTENGNGSATAYAPVTVRPFCGAPPATEVSAPATSPSGEPYEVSWIPTLQGDERGQYVFHESPDPEFLELDGWGTWIHTSTQVTHRWTEAGSFYHRVLSINYCPDGDYWSPPSATVRVDIEPDVTDLGDHFRVITAAAHGSGLEDTSWVTDVVVHNPDRHPAPAYLFLLPREGDGEPVGSLRHWVEPGQSLHLADAVADLQLPGFGALLVASDRPQMVGSRTFNEHEDGSYGQFIEGVSIDSSDRGDGGARLIQLTQNERYRTNLALANPLPEATVVTVDLHRADGELLGSSDYSLPGLSSLLDVEVLADTGHGDVADAYAVVSSASSDGRWTALASVVDNASGDPVAFPALTTHPRHRVVARDDVPVIGHRAWYDILFAGDVYVASGQGAIAWSRDGVSWHPSDGIDIWNRVSAPLLERQPDPGRQPVLGLLQRRRHLLDRVVLQRRWLRHRRVGRDPLGGSRRWRRRLDRGRLQQRRGDLGSAAVRRHQAARHHLGRGSVRGRRSFRTRHERRCPRLADDRDLRRLGLGTRLERPAAHRTRGVHDLYQHRLREFHRP